MVELIVVLMVIAALLVFVPIFALMQAARARRELTRLRREIEPRLDRLERLDRDWRSAVVTPSPAPGATRGGQTPTASPAPTTPRPGASPVEATAVIEPAIPGPADTWESRIGSRWFLYAGVAAIVVAVSYFVKLAFESGLITETMRVLIGAVAGLALAWAGGRFVRAGYSFYGQILIGGGLAIFYVSIYAAFNFYALVPRTLAFALMVAVTAGAAWLADRHRSPGLAVMAVGGGFLTPFLVGGETGAQVALFGYDLILVAGTMLLARRLDWPPLDLVGFSFAVLTIATWLATSYTAAAYLRTAIFLTLFCALFVVMLAGARRSPQRVAPAVGRVLATAPPVYYVTMVAILVDHSIALLIFLVLFSLAAIIASRRLESDAGRLLTWVAVELPLLAWARAHAGPSWVVAGSASILAVYALHLATQLDLFGRRLRGPSRADVALLHANGLALFGNLAALIGPWRDDWLGAVALLVAVWNGALAMYARRLLASVPLHLAALSAALVAVAVAVQFAGAWQVVGWAIEAAALVWIGLRTRQGWLRVGGGLLMLAACVDLVTILLAPISTGYVVVLNVRAMTGLLVVGLLYGLSVAHRRLADASDGLARDGDYFQLASTLVLLVLATTEINAFYELRRATGTGAFARASTLVVTWTLIGTQIARLGLDRRREWLRLIGAAILLGALSWLVSMLVGRTPRTYLVLINPRVTAAVVFISALGGLAWLRAKVPDRSGGRAATEVAALVLLANVLMIAVASAEIHAFWRLRIATAIGSPVAFEFARELSLSTTWAAYAAGLIAAGIHWRYTPVRYLGILLFGVTLLKVLLVDLSELDRLYRVLSVLALGLLLLIASYLYQRNRLRLGSPTDQAGA